MACAAIALHPMSPADLTPTSPPRTGQARRRCGPEKKAVAHCAAVCAATVSANEAPICSGIWRCIWVHGVATEQVRAASALCTQRRRVNAAGLRLQSQLGCKAAHTTCLREVGIDPAQVAAVCAAPQAPGIRRDEDRRAHAAGPEGDAAAAVRALLAVAAQQRLPVAFPAVAVCGPRHVERQAAGPVAVALRR